jgi:CBS domain-containing protein
MKLSEVPLRAVPVVEPQTALSEVYSLLDGEPLKTVVLVGDEMYMGVFNEELRASGQIPEDVDPSLLQVGPYALGLRFTGSPQMEATDALALMDRHQIAVLPVVTGNLYRGVVTRADLEGRG